MLSQASKALLGGFPCEGTIAPEAELAAPDQNSPSWPQVSRRGPQRAPGSRKSTRQTSVARCPLRAPSDVRPRHVPAGGRAFKLVSTSPPEDPPGIHRGLVRVLVKLAIPEVRGVRPQAAGSSGWPHTTQCGSYPQARRCEVVKAYWRGARLTVDAVPWRLRLDPGQLPPST